MQKHRYTQKEIDFIFKHLRNYESYSEFCKAFNAEFGTNISRGSMSDLCIKRLKYPIKKNSTRYSIGHRDKALPIGTIRKVSGGCTYIKVSNTMSHFSGYKEPDLFRGGKLNQERYQKGLAAKDFFLKFLNADCPRICVENPVSSRIYEMPPYSQEIQPWMFGHPVQKKTRLWLKGLPLLEATNIVVPKCGCHEAGTWFMKGGKDRQKNRAKTFPGVGKGDGRTMGQAMSAGGRGGHMMQKCCFNCAYCSESYPSFIDSCDLDGKNIPDVYTQVCEKFEAVED